MAQVKKTSNWFFDVIKPIHQGESIFYQTSYELFKDAIKQLYLTVNDLVIEVVITLNVRSASFYIPQFSDGNFQSTVSFDGSKCQINKNHPLVSYLLQHRGLLIKSNLSGLIQGAQSRAEVKNLEEINLELTKHQTVIVGGIYSDQELIGVLLVGAKASGLFGSQDLSYISYMLNSSSKQLAQIMHFRKTQAMVLRRTEGRILELT